MTILTANEQPEWDGALEYYSFRFDEGGLPWMGCGRQHGRWVTEAHLSLSQYALRICCVTSHHWTGLCRVPQSRQFWGMVTGVINSAVQSDAGADTGAPEIW
jgi:hypothetical protein